MREIKFRGYVKDYKKWYYGYLSRPREDSCYTIYKDKVTHYPINVEEASIGQYTGFKDKNGKEIYEGDIISDKIRTFQIWFNDGLGVWEAVDVYDEFHRNIITGIFTKTYHGEYEVIGNIYEEKLREGKQRCQQKKIYCKHK